jgi:hypothetical protein
MTRSRIGLGAIVLASVVAATAVYVVPAMSSKTAVGPSAVDRYSVLGEVSRVPVDPRLSYVTRLIRSVDEADLTTLHVLRSGVGRFSSRLVMFPSQTGGIVCYALLATEATDPGMSYCTQPLSEALPSGIRRQHFTVSALESREASGAVTTQVFGIAFDDVETARLGISVSWLVVPVDLIGLYLALDGIERDDIGVLEATLTTGTVQRYDFQAGS